MLTISKMLKQKKHWTSQPENIKISNIVYRYRMIKRKISPCNQVNARKTQTGGSRSGND
jgi:hypothetical protein